MKKHLLLTFVIFNSIFSYAQDCNIGNPDSLGFDFPVSEFTKNIILGTKYTLTEEGTLNSFNLIGRNSGSQVQMALYADNNGVPNDLIITSGISIVDSGLITLPISSIPLTPGDYWVMAIYDSSAIHSYVKNPANGATVYYMNSNFGDPLPANATNFLSYSDSDFTYFLQITCGSVDVNNLALENQITVSPNPANDFIHISKMENKKNTLEIFDLQGKKVKTIKVDSTEVEVDISDFAKGTYLVIINKSKHAKIIKL